MSWYYTREPGDEGQILTDEGQPKGVALSDLQANGALPVKAALELVACLADAVSIAEEDKAVHGDLDEASIFVQSNGSVSISGYGQTRRNTRAPEGRPHGIATDVYALGQVLHGVLSGQSLGQAPRDRDGHDDHVVARLLRIDWGELADKPWMQDVRSFLCSMLAWQPEERPAALDVANVLFQVAAQAPGKSLPDWAARAVPAAGGARVARAPRPMIEEMLGGPQELGGPVASNSGFKVRQAGSAKGQSTAIWSREKIAAMLTDDEDEDLPAEIPARQAWAPPPSPAPLPSPTPVGMPPGPPAAARPAPAPPGLPPGLPPGPPPTATTGLPPGLPPGMPMPGPTPVMVSGTPPGPVAKGPVAVTGGAAKAEPPPKKKKSPLMMVAGLFLVLFLLCFCGGGPLVGGYYYWSTRGAGDFTIPGSEPSLIDEGAGLGEPTEVPTEEPTEEPTEAPAEEPTDAPAEEPAEEPTPTPDPPKADPTPTATTGGGSTTSSSASSGSSGSSSGSTRTTTGSSGGSTSTSTSSSSSTRTSGSSGSSGTTSSSGSTGTSSSASSAGTGAAASGSGFAVKFAVTSGEATVRCGDGQGSTFAGTTSLRFNTVTTCVVVIEDARGAIQVDRSATVTCSKAGTSVSCSAS